MEKKRVVVVGEHWESQMMVSLALEGAGYDTINLSSNKNMIAAMRNLNPDLVMLDLDLPRLRISQIIRALRHDKRTARVPIIGILPQNYQQQAAMTGYGSLADVFPQSVDRSLLIRKVRRILRDDRAANVE